MRGKLTDIYINHEILKDLQRWRVIEEDGVIIWWLEDEAYLLYERIMEHGY